MTAEQFKERFVSLYSNLFAIAMANIGNCEEAKDIMQSFNKRSLADDADMFWNVGI